MLSLNEAAASQENGWSLGEPTTHTTVRFAELEDGVATLNTSANTHEGTKREE
jgi:hypothetical protein